MNGYEDFTEKSQEDILSLEVHVLNVENKNLENAVMAARKENCCLQLTNANLYDENIRLADTAKKQEEVIEELKNRLKYVEETVKLLERSRDYYKDGVKKLEENCLKYVSDIDGYKNSIKEKDNFIAALKQAIAEKGEELFNCKKKILASFACNRDTALPSISQEGLIKLIDDILDEMKRRKWPGMLVYSTSVNHNDSDLVVHSRRFAKLSVMPFLLKVLEVGVNEAVKESVESTEAGEDD